MAVCEWCSLRFPSFACPPAVLLLPLLPHFSQDLAAALPLSLLPPPLLLLLPLSPVLRCAFVEDMSDELTVCSRS